MSNEEKFTIYTAAKIHWTNNTRKKTGSSKMNGVTNENMFAA